MQETRFNQLDLPSELIYDERIILFKFFSKTNFKNCMKILINYIVKFNVWNFFFIFIYLSIPRISMIIIEHPKFKSIYLLTMNPSLSTK